MSLKTLLKFLVGDREAILTIARSPQALWIGLLFVMSAALAREYDKESLLHEPWHLLLPLAASLLTSFVLFILFYGPPIYRVSRPPFFASYRSFLQVFWMTAPMAWLYAIPWERICESPADATSMNLWTLGLVSAWRVLLITRVLSVLFNMHAVAVFFIVMLYSHVAAILSLSMLPFSVINIMGGVQLGESEQLIAGIGTLIFMLGFIAVPLWLIVSIGVYALARPRWELAEQTFPIEGERLPAPAAPLRGVAIVLIVFGLALLPLTQPEQMRRHKAETLLRTGRIDAALAFMSEHDPSEFPPHWDPPPRFGYLNRRPAIDAVAERIIEAGAADWVRDIYLAKLHQHVRQRWRARGATWEKLAEDADDLWWLHRGGDRSLVAILALDESLTDDERAAIEVLIESARERDRSRSQREASGEA